MASIPLAILTQRNAWFAALIVFCAGMIAKLGLTSHFKNTFALLAVIALFVTLSAGLFILPLNWIPLSWGMAFLGASPTLMTALAVVMFGYAALIAFNTQRSEINRGFTVFTVIGDSAWVLASVLLLVLPVFSFIAAAKWAIGITPIFVDIFAIIQFLECQKQR